MQLSTGSNFRVMTMFTVTCDDGVDELYKLMGTEKGKIEK